MLSLVLFFTVSVVLEFAIHLLPEKPAYLRRLWGLLVVVAIGAFTASTFSTSITALTVVVGVISIYRAFNIGRILKARMHANYLLHATRRTSLWLIGVQSLIGLVYLWNSQVIFNFFGLWLAALCVEFVVAWVILRTIRRYYKRMLNPIAADHSLDATLPSVSVAIPARDETNDLQECIESLLRSDYPKLEIIVLDDCSQTTRTPEIIRSFAHAGVRFIKGEYPKENWLAKNQAYAALTEASSGKFLLFAGVDMRFEPNSIRQLVTNALEHNKSMICTIPKNHRLHSQIPLLQPTRYFLEMALPRRPIAAPPVLSSCWLISREALSRAGGFQAVPRKVVPEEYFAKQQLPADGYSFLASGDTYGIQSTKTLAEQRVSSILTSYPRLHRRPEIVAVISFGLTVGLVLPISSIVVWLVAGSYIIPAALGLASFALILSAYYYVFLIAYGRASIADIAAFPLAIILELSLLHYSMYKYEFDEVIWKGRNICIPIMRQTTVNLENKS